MIISWPYTWKTQAVEIEKYRNTVVTINFSFAIWKKKKFMDAIFTCTQVYE